MIKLGIDAHAKGYYVARQVDGSTPQPVRKMTFDGLLLGISFFIPSASFPPKVRVRWGQPHIGQGFSSPPASDLDKSRDR